MRPAAPRRLPLRAVLLLLLPALCSAPLLASRPLACYPMQEAVSHLDKNVCISAHVYNVVELPDGTRFLDLCSAAMTDDACRFSIVSYREDSKEVGDLNQYKDHDVEVRGTVHGYRGRGQMVLSHARQFHGGAEKFKPNPALLKGFSAEDEKTAFNDPNLRSKHHHNSASVRH